jgi:hypothetical protein
LPLLGEREMRAEWLRRRANLASIRRSGWFKIVEAALAQEVVYHLSVRQLVVVQELPEGTVAFSILGQFKKKALNQSIDNSHRRWASLGQPYQPFSAMAEVILPGGIPASMSGTVFPTRTHQSFNSSGIENSPEWAAASGTSRAKAFRTGDLVHSDPPSPSHDSDDLRQPATTLSHVTPARHNQWPEPNSYFFAEAWSLKTSPLSICSPQKNPSV